MPSPARFLASLLLLTSPAWADSMPSLSLPRTTAADAPGIPAETLEGAVRRAIQSNPQAAIAEEEIHRVEGVLREVRAASLPIVTGLGTYTRLDNDRVLVSTDPTTGMQSTRVIIPADTAAASLLITAPILAVNRWLAWKNAKGQVRTTRLAAADVRRTIAVTAARAYLAVINQRRIVEAQERARDAARAHADFAHARFTGGVGNRIDDVRARQELSTSETNLQAARANLVRAREALGVIAAADGPLDAVEDPRALAAGMPALDDALRGAERGRADIDAQRARVELATRIAHDSWADWLPILTASWQGTAQTVATLTTPPLSWQGQLVLSIPLYDGGFRYGVRRERISLQKEAEATLESALRQARSEVRAAFESMQRADASLLAAREAAQLAAEARDLANIAYRAGAVTNIEIIDAERRARDADTAAALAEDAARQARLDLLAAAGRFP